MQGIVLKNRTPEGDLLEATFLPEKGMNLISFKRGDKEVMAQSTRERFEKGFNGLGPLIGPHFYQRNSLTISKLENEALFPHIQALREHNELDPFTHGIARYAPWKAEMTETKITGMLTGKDTLNGIPLSVLEGQDFKMLFSAELTPEGLKLDLSVVSQTDSLVGIHYYYHLPENKGKIIANVEDMMIQDNLPQTIPIAWLNGSPNSLNLELKEHIDVTLYPHPDPLNGKILLETSEYSLITRYSCNCQENSWQLYHPTDANFVCIEPVSSQDPRHANLSASSIKIHLQIL